MTLVTQTGSTVVVPPGPPPAAPPAAPVPWPSAQILDLLRQRIGLVAGDTTKDAEITASWVLATQLAEQYLDRFLQPGSYSEQFTHVDRTTLSLKGYPLTDLPVVTDYGGGASLPFHVEPSTGMVHFDKRMISHSLTVEYDCSPPEGLLVAMLALFDSVWASVSSTGGAVAAGGIKSITSAGSTISYFDPSSGGGAGGIDADSGLPAGVAALLNPFKRRYA